MKTNIMALCLALAGSLLMSSCKKTYLCTGEDDSGKKHFPISGSKKDRDSYAEELTKVGYKNVECEEF
ncbi:MAG: hypothetical protein NZ522_02290 [Chitinophagales bacterium]|nr:hypothetical protein [Chitinophagales bacterium]